MIMTRIKNVELLLTLDCGHEMPLIIWKFVIVLRATVRSFYISLHKILKFHLNSFCRNIGENHSFHKVSGELPETLRKLRLSTKFPHQEIRWNFCSLCSICFKEVELLTYIDNFLIYYISTWTLGDINICKLHLIT